MIDTSHAHYLSCLLLHSEMQRYKKGKMENTVREPSNRHKGCYMASPGAIGGIGNIIVRAEGNVSRKWEQTNKKENKYRNKQKPQNSLESKLSFTRSAQLSVFEMKLNSTYCSGVCEGRPDMKLRHSSGAEDTWPLSAMLPASDLYKWHIPPVTMEYHCLLFQMPLLWTTDLVVTTSHHESNLCGIYSLLLDSLPYSSPWQAVFHYGKLRH